MASSKKPYYGHLVIGPPGCGKTTYCNEMAELLKNQFGRKVVLVNLDPANECLPYKPDIDVQECVRVEDVMELEQLGPNGALIFSMEQLERDTDWLFSKISERGPDIYYIFDCPGQIELYTHHKSFLNICQNMIKKFDFRLGAAFLADSYYCSDPALFISVVLTAMSAMMRIALPHINLLSKVDLIESMGKLEFDLRYYSQDLDLGQISSLLGMGPFGKKYAKLTKAIAEVVEDYSLVTFMPVSVKDKETFHTVIKALDKCIGYYKSDLEERQVRKSLADIPKPGPELDYSIMCNLQQKYIRHEEFDPENLPQ